MAVVEVTSTGWLARIGKSIKGVVFGMILFVVAFPLLFWNEGRAVQTAQSLEEGAGAVVTVQPDRVDGAFEKKLVHMNGEAKTGETLRDDEFGVSAAAIKLIRDVEMYQWRESKKSSTKKKLGGGEETTTRYDYDKTWSSQVIDSSSFKESGHNNPSRMPYESQTVAANHVTVGAYRLSPDQIDKLDDAQPLRMETRPAGLSESQARLENGGLFVGGSPGNPNIGDVRINFSVVKPGPVSLIAQQVGDTFAAYQTKAGDALLMIDQGTLSSTQMFKDAQDANTMITWLIRFGGWLAMFIGLAMIAKPLSVLGDVVPFIGSVIGAGTGLFAFLIASFMATMTVAVAWIAYRPLLGIGLMLVGGLAVAALVVRTRKKNAAAPAMGRAT